MHPAVSKIQGRLHKHGVRWLPWIQLVVGMCTFLPLFLRTIKQHTVTLQEQHSDPANPERLYCLLVAQLPGEVHALSLNIHVTYCPTTARNFPESMQLIMLSPKHHSIIAKVYNAVPKVALLDLQALGSIVPVLTSSVSKGLGSSPYGVCIIHTFRRHHNSASYHTAFLSI